VRAKKPERGVPTAAVEEDLDVLAERPGDLLRIVEQAAEVEPADVVEA
jgi:hypothetical protein